jgi:DNA-binding NtrC family response regulator
MATENKLQDTMKGILHHIQDLTETNLEKDATINDLTEEVKTLKEKLNAHDNTHDKTAFIAQLQCLLLSHQRLAKELENHFYREIDALNAQQTTNDIPKMSQSKVLIVDDDPLIVDLVLQIFADSSHRVFKAANATEAENLRVHQYIRSISF